MPVRESAMPVAVGIVAAVGAAGTGSVGFMLIAMIGGLSESVVASQEQPISAMAGEATASDSSSAITSAETRREKLISQTTIAA